MKELMLISMFLMGIITLSSCGDNAPSIELPEEKKTEIETPDSEMQVSITIGDRKLNAVLYDNSAAKDLYSRLPVEVVLSDFNNVTEKIFYPDPKLDLADVTRGCAPEPGDITIYEPWGNVAIFCKKWSFSRDLIKIGYISDDGITALSISGDIAVRIEHSL